MNSPLEKPSAVLFDLDGTLINTTAVYFKMVDLTLIPGIVSPGGSG
jgi:FMN phosphatase YigB (HAD superfamily)